MTTENSKHLLFKHDYLLEIKCRLSAKAGVLNVSYIHRQTGVSRPVIQAFINGEVPTNISFANVVKLYKYIEEQKI